ncbi:MAG: IclR family transcriptional regulator [Oscillospiraceae bacterium]|nr:IclR family transcriptional regulator [Oscillospiraceae bacterium]
MPDTRKTTKPNQSGEKLLKIMEFIADQGAPVRVLDIAKGMDSSSSTILRFLRTLEDCGYVGQDPSSLRYYLTFKVCGVANKVIASTDIRDIVHPYLRDLAHMMGETVCLAVEDAFSVAYVDVVEGRYSIIRNLRRIGTVAPMHCTGMGKVLLMEANSEKLDRLVEEKGLERFTDNTITTRQDLERELEEVRERGWAYDNEECEIGARCIAFPIRNYTGKIVAAFSVTGLVARMADAFLDTRIGMLRDTAAMISRELGFEEAPAEA